MKQIINFFACNCVASYSASEAKLTNRRDSLKFKIYVHNSASEEKLTNRQEKFEIYVYIYILKIENFLEMPLEYVCPTTLMRMNNS